MKTKLKPMLTFLIGWPLSLLALFFIVNTFLPKFQDISQNLRNLRWEFLGIGMLCFFSYYAIRSCVWYMLVKKMGYDLPFAQTVSLWSVSEVKRYIPGNIWSFVGRSVAFVNKGLTKGDIAKAMLWEQEIVLLASLLASVLSLPFLAAYLFPFLREVPYLELLGILFIVVVGGGYLFVPYYLHKLPTKLQKIFRHILPNLLIRDMFVLLVLSCLAFLCFGFGYYFSIAALHPLEPQLFFVLSGFFIFSLVVGLLSFLTPTGLGVREGVITIGLGKIIPISVAGFASLFGRILLVLSEVLFLFVTLGLSKLHKNRIARVESFVTRNFSEITVGFFIILFSVYFSVISFLRYDNFYTGRFDLGNMVQTVWNTAHGRFFTLTDPNGTEIVSRLAFHSDFILVGLVPFYWIWEDPRMLLAIQAIVLACGAIFVYLLAKDILNNKLLAVVFSFSYLLNPAMQRTVIYDFHAVTLATTFLLGAFYFLHKKRYWWFVIFVLLAGITKEEIWTITALMGLYLVFLSFRRTTESRRQQTHGSRIKSGMTILRKKPILIGLLTFFVSTFLFYFLMWHAIPQAGEGSHFALKYFSDGGDSPSALIKNVIFSPDKTVEKLLHPERIEYYKKLLGPLGYLPLLSPLYLIFPGADLALNILSDKAELHQIYYQYTAPITPFLFIAAFYGIRFIRKLRPVPIHFFTAYVLLVAIYCAYLYGPLPGAKEPNLAMINRQRPHREYITNALRSIDEKYSVSASNALGAQLSHRHYIYTLPNGVDKADVVAFLLSGGYNQPSQNWHEQKVEELKKDSRYEIWFEKDEFIVFRRKL